jgi:hypothetical protein
MLSTDDVPKLSDVREEIDRLESKGAFLIAEQARLGAAITEERENSARRFIEQDDDSGAATVREMESRLDLIARALELLDVKLSEAAITLKLAQAADMRDLAAAKSEELKTLRERTAALLAKLSEIEGVAYDHSILQAQRIGAWYSVASYCSDGRVVDDYAQPYEALREPVGVDAGRFAFSKSRRLRDEIRQLLANAEQLEMQARPRPRPSPEPAPKAPHEPTLYGEPIRKRHFIKGKLETASGVIVRGE